MCLQQHVYIDKNTLWRTGDLLLMNAVCWCFSWFIIDSLIVLNMQGTNV